MNARPLRTGVLQVWYAEGEGRTFCHLGRDLEVLTLHKRFCKCQNMCVAGRGVGGGAGSTAQKSSRGKGKKEREGRTDFSSDCKSHDQCAPHS